MTERTLTPLEKARLAKQLKQRQKKAEQNEVPEKVEQQEVEQPVKQKTYKELDDPVLETKMDAIIDKIPLIEKCNEICEFLLEHYGLQKLFKAQMEFRADERSKSKLYKMFEYYGIPEGTETDVQKLYSYTYISDEHVGEICKYLAIKGIEYERSSFIIKELPKHEPTHYVPGIGPQFSNIVPQGVIGK